MSDSLNVWRGVIAPFTVLSIRHVADYDEQLDDYYGNFTDNPRADYYVDRKEGLLRGPRKEWTEDFPTEAAKDERAAELEDLGFSIDDVFTAITVTLDETDDEGQPDFEIREFADDQEDEYNRFWYEIKRAYGWNPTVTEERKVWRIEIAGDEILADGLATRDDSGTYRYQEFSSDYAHCPTEPWSSLTDAQKAEYIGYMTSVYRRSVEYFRNYWGYMGIIVEIHWKKEEIASSSFGGVETDMDEGTLTQYELELIDEALTYAVVHFAEESKKYGVQIDAPAELVRLAALSYDELKPIRNKVRETEVEAPWGNRGAYARSVYAYIDGLENEDLELYNGTKEVENADGN